jgi:hypothetical protein
MTPHLEENPAGPGKVMTGGKARNSMHFKQKEFADGLAQ